jgi:Sulfotransferase family
LLRGPNCTDLHFELPLFPNNPYLNAKLFGVVRNPFDRLISEYFYLVQFLRHEKVEEKTASELDEWLRSTVGRTKNNATKGDIAHSVSGNGPYFAASGHFIPQYDYVYEGDRKVMHHVLKYERLHEDFDALMKQYDMNLTLPAKQDNHVRKTTKHLSMADLSPDVIQLIETVYANDFREFGYDLLSPKMAKL